MKQYYQMLFLKLLYCLCFFDVNVFRPNSLCPLPISNSIFFLSFNVFLSSSYPLFAAISQWKVLASSSIDINSLSKTINFLTVMDFCKCKAWKYLILMSSFMFYNLISLNFINEDLEVPSSFDTITFVWQLLIIYYNKYWASFMAYLAEILTLVLNLKIMSFKNSSYLIHYFEFIN